MAYLSTEEARQIKRHALFADTFGALDRVALQRGLRHLDRKAVSQCLASGIENVAEMIFRSSPPGCGDTNIIKVSLDDEQVVVYASIEDGPVIFLPPAIPACGIERTLFVEAFALLMQLPFSLPSLADVYAYWGWTSDDVEVIRDWLPTVFQQADLSREQMARVIRQTARHSPMPQLESFDMTDKQDFFRLAREVVGAIENDEFLAFFQRVSRQAARQTPHRERLAVMVENVSRLQNADSIIFWTMFLDDLSQILTYHETHETALQQAQEAADMVGNDRLALLSDVYLTPDTASAVATLDEYYDHFMQVGEEAAEVFPMEGEWANRVRMTVDFANIQYSTAERLAARLRELHFARHLHNC